MSAEQRAAVADGQVTEAEYEAGYRRFSTCMSASAVPLRETGRRGSLRTFLIPDDAVTAGIDERCYRRHFAQIDGLYQGAHERESETYLTLAACVRAIGDEPDPTDTSADLVDRLEHAGSSQEACFQRASGGMAAP